MAQCARFKLPQLELGLNCLQVLNDLATTINGPREFVRFFFAQRYTKQTWNILKHPHVVWLTVCCSDAAGRRGRNTTRSRWRKSSSVFSLGALVHWCCRLRLVARPLRQIPVFEIIAKSVSGPSRRPAGVAHVWGQRYATLRSPLQTQSRQACLLTHK